MSPERRRSSADLPRTEGANPATADLDKLPTREVLRRIAREDATVPAAVARELDAIESAVGEIAARLEAGGRLIYVGAGTSGRLATMEAAEAPPTFGVDAGTVIGIMAGGGGAERAAREAAEDDTVAAMDDIARLRLSERDALVGVSASGRTPYVLAAVEAAAGAGALTVSVACDHPTPLGALATIAIHPVTGPEVLAGSTRMKAGTAQKLVLNMLTTATMARLGRVHGNLMIDVRPTNRKLRARARRIVEEVSGRHGAEVDDALEAAGWSARVAAEMLVRGLSAQEVRAQFAAGDGSGAYRSPPRDTQR